MIKHLLSDYSNQFTFIKALDGYESKNFLVENGQNEKFVLKYYENIEGLPLIEAENKVLCALQENSSHSITPKPILKTVKSHHRGFSRILSYMDGELLGSLAMNAELAHSEGKMCGRLLQSLAQIEEPFYHNHSHQWNILNALTNLDHIDYVEGAREKNYIKFYLDQFQFFTLQKLNKLPKQLIHGDLNEWNIVVENNEVTGFFDFGDMSYGPVVNEIGIALAYVMMPCDDPIKMASSFLKGLSSQLSLSEEEVSLLPSIIVTRLCVSVLNSAYAKKHNPKSDYVLVSEKPAWALLKKWNSWSPEYLINTFKIALGKEIPNLNNTYDYTLEKREKQLGSSLKLSYKKPIFMVSGAFQYMYDCYGNAYLDTYNNIPILGHAHPAVSEAASRQVRLLYTNSRYLTDSTINYAEKLLSYFPESLDTVFFVNSGTEANDLASRIVSTYRNTQGRIVLEMGYHGHSQNGIEISSYKYGGKGGNGKPPHILELPLPKIFEGRFATGEEYAEEAIQLIANEISKGNTYSSFIFEPISGCGGQVPLAKNYLKLVTQYCKANNILTISDEVQVGFGRLGKYFWGYEMHDIIPDIVVLGKPMGNGFPLAAVVTTKAIANRFDNGMEFFSSFGGNQISTEVGLAVLNTIKEEGLQDHAENLGRYFMLRLQDIKSRNQVIADVRGQGFFIGIEFKGIKDKSATQVAKEIKEGLKSRYILTSTDGKFNETLKLKGPLCFSKDNVDQFCSAFMNTLKSL